MALSPSVVSSLKQKFEEQAKQDGSLKPPISSGGGGFKGANSRETSPASSPRKSAESFFQTNQFLPSPRNSQDDASRPKIAARSRTSLKPSDNAFLRPTDSCIRTQSDTQVEILRHVVEVRPKKSGENIALATHLEEKSEEEAGPRPKTAVGFVDQARSFANNAAIGVRGRASGAGMIIQSQTSKLSTHVQKGAAGAKSGISSTWTSVTGGNKERSPFESNASSSDTPDTLLRLSGALGDILIKLPLKRGYLCSQCREFAQNVASKPGTGPRRPWRNRLRNMILHKNGCRLCILLLQVLCQPENDPFRLPQISDHLPSGSATNMKSLLSRSVVGALQSSWPFGRVEVSEKEMSEGDASSNIISEYATDAANFIADLGIKVGVGAAKTAISLLIMGASKDQIEKRVGKGAVDDSTGHFVENPTGKANTKSSLWFKKCLPCYLEVQPDRNLSGEVKVFLWGHGNGPLEKKSVLSRFGLRLGPEVTNDLLSFSSPLSHGRVLNPQIIELRLIQQCIEDCQAQHGAACIHGIADFPVSPPEYLRLVDIESMQLVEFRSEKVIARLQYAALSYVWGNANDITLVSSNKASLHRPGGLRRYLDNKSLPATLRHAFMVTEAAGLQYVWIDALCIQQDGKGDQQHLFEKMDSVYGHALFTIVAAEGSNANAGLPGVEEDTPRQVTQLSTKLDDGRVIVAPLPVPPGLEESNWNKRAWTLQERLLSRRLVFFYDDQMIWRCRGMTVYEDMAFKQYEDTYQWHTLTTRTTGHQSSSSLASSDGGIDISHSRTFVEYTNVINQYSGRQMKYSSDALRASAGILNTLGQCLVSPIHYGLPTAFLDAALLWQPTNPLLPRFSSKIPTWSWAYWEGKVHYQFVPYRPLLDYYLQHNGNLMSIRGTPLDDRTLNTSGWEFAPPGTQNLSKLEDYILENPSLLSTSITDTLLFFQTSALPTSAFDVRVASSLQANNPNQPLRLRLLRPLAPYSPYSPNSSSSPSVEVGSVTIDAETVYVPQTFGRLDLIVLCEVQEHTSGDWEGWQKVEGILGYSYYMVMLIEWDKQGLVAKRRGLGRVDKGFWKWRAGDVGGRWVALS